MPKKGSAVDTKHESKFFVLLCKFVSACSIKPEYKFHPDRRWRFDFAIEADKIAFEVEGGIWTGGRHIHPLGFIKDCEKYNEAAKLGWRVFRLTPEFITEDYVRSLLQKD